MKNLTLLLSVALFCSAASAAESDVQTAEARAYLNKFNDLLQKHIDALSAATDAIQAAQAMQNYAKDLKPMLTTSKAMKKKFPKMGGDNIEIRSAMQALTTKTKKMNELLVEAKKKYGRNKLFKKAEKSVMAAGRER